jgi:pimeloyl-ACP methyl ester carboxylesterase
VYVPDLPGFGRSPQPNVDYTIGFEAQAVIDFMRAMRLDHADVAGWSMGGWVAAKLTLDHPEMVDRLALYDSAGVYFPRTFDASLFLPENAAEMFHLSAMLMPDPKPLPGFVVKAAIRKLRRNDRVIRSSVAAMLSGRDLLDFRMQQISKPTLIVWGQQDKLIPLAAGEKMYREIPNSLLFVVEGCGHLAPAQCWKPILKETAEFFTANPPPGRSLSVVPGK